MAVGKTALLPLVDSCPLDPIDGESGASGDRTGDLFIEGCRLTSGGTKFGGKLYRGK